MGFFETLLFSVSVTAPLLAWMLGGAILRWLGVLTASWRERINRTIYYVSLPLLMFVSIIKQPVNEVWEAQLTGTLCLVTLLIFALAQCWARLTAARVPSLSPLNQALVVQASFRGNLGIIGLLLCLNVYGETAMPVASLLMALVSLLYNVLAVFSFESAAQRQRGEGASGLARVCLNMLLNPLILATLVALTCNALRVRVDPQWLALGEGFVGITLPLALLSIGASLELRRPGRASPIGSGRDQTLGLERAALPITLLLKLLLAPLLAVSLAAYLGYRDMSLGIVFFLAASPTAAASYVMAKAYGADEGLAAQAVLYSTLLSLLSISAGVFILRGLGWL